MAKEYIEREAALRIANGFCHPANIGDEIAKLPAADVVEVVRCKDCKYRYDDDFCGGRGWPEQLVPDDGYCNNGTIKDGGV